MSTRQFFKKPPHGIFFIVFVVLFALTSVGAMQFGSVVVEKEHAPGSIVCDIHTPVTDAACSSDGMLLLLLSILALAAAWVSAVPFFNAQLTRSTSWRLYRFSYACTRQRIFSSIQEAFRRGIIHPKIYHTAV